MDRLRLFIITDESIYYPDFIINFIKRTDDEIVGAIITKNSPSNVDFEKYLLTHFYCFKPSEFVELFRLKFTMKFKDMFSRDLKKEPFYSLKSVYNAFNIDYFEIIDNVNRDINLEKIREKSPDIIINSSPYIFKKDILQIPKICCLNRHFSLLPSYRGLLGIFHALSNGEKYTGCSVHVMDKKIDHGPILAQDKVEILKGDTLHSLHEKCFNIGVDTLVHAINKARRNDFSDVGNDVKSSYFSFPTLLQWREFRKKGRYII